MRDVFDEIFARQPVDPSESARRSMRALKRRFYDEVAFSLSPSRSSPAHPRSA
jgi:hypothetical protein